MQRIIDALFKAIGPPDTGPSVQACLNSKNESVETMEQETQETLDRRGKVEAIKFVRSRVHVSLTQAKNFVDRIESHTAKRPTNDTL